MFANESPLPHTVSARPPSNFQNVSRSVRLEIFFQGATNNFSAFVNAICVEISTSDFTLVLGPQCTQRSDEIQRARRKYRKCASKFPEKICSGRFES